MELELHEEKFAEYKFTQIQHSRFDRGLRGLGLTPAEEFCHSYVIHLD